MTTPKVILMVVFMVRSLIPTEPDPNWGSSPVGAKSYAKELPDAV